MLGQLVTFSIVASDKEPQDCARTPTISDVSRYAYVHIVHTCVFSHTDTVHTIHVCGGKN